MAASGAKPAENGTSKEDEFRRFDVVTDCSDHTYFPRNCNKKNKHCLNDGSNTYKNIMKEWRLLEKLLPEAIFVRVYENRIDLLRAMIIGAAGTPYQDGLFFFDIAFPFDYPNSPPLVKYLSRGLRLNPNLYSSGKVCLSLLNTWEGKPSERWNPNTSTIFQVLISLQGLVLNEKPYYNDPWVKPARSWQLYNQAVFALCCKTMVYLLRKPPKNFETIVSAHFRERAYAILRACKDYRNGCASIGFFSVTNIKVSSSFKKSMDEIYPLLLTAFTSNGASVQNLLEEEQQAEEEKAKNKIKVKKNSSSLTKFVGKLFSCLKKDDEKIKD